LVADHEGCIVQSYVQWLQDSEYQAICLLCKNLLKDEPTVRLICYDVFHWSCLDKYASELPATTAPAGYQCPKCKECIFPPSNLVSPVVDILRNKLEATSWARVGLGQSLLEIGDSTLADIDDAGQASTIEINNREKPINSNLSSTSNLLTAVTDDESNGFVIVNGKKKHVPSTGKTTFSDSSSTHHHHHHHIDTSSHHSNQKQEQQKQHLVKSSNRIQESQDQHTNESQSHYHNRAGIAQTSSQDNESHHVAGSQDVILNVDNSLDRDTGDYKYQRRPLFEWLNRWLRSRQILSRSPIFRMTRQKKILFIIIFVFICFFTLIIVFSQLGSIVTEDDPALDPMNNPNIHVQ
jgi:hypothetical protein